MLQSRRDHARVRHATGLLQARWRQFLGVFIGAWITVLTPVWALAGAAALLVGARPLWRTRAHAAAARWTLWLSGQDLDRLSRWTGTTVHDQATPPGTPCTC